MLVRFVDRDMMMRYLGGGIGHRIWHLLPQPQTMSTTKKKATNYPTPDEITLAPGISDSRRKRKDPSDEGPEKLTEDEERDCEILDFDYGEPEMDQEGDWVDENDEDNIGPEEDGDGLLNNDYDLKGFAEL